MVGGAAGVLIMEAGVQGLGLLEFRMLRFHARSLLIGFLGSDLAPGSLWSTVCFRDWSKLTAHMDFILRFQNLESFYQKSCFPFFWELQDIGGPSTDPK